MQAAGADGGKAGARTIAVDRHPDPEQHGAERHRQEVCRLDVIGGEAARMQNENADAADNDRGQHHLEQSVIAQPQLRDDHVVCV